MVLPTRTFVDPTSICRKEESTEERASNTKAVGPEAVSLFLAAQRLHKGQPSCS